MATIVAMILVSGCTTRTTGMQAPLAHDYDGLQWRLLETDVTQRVVVAPGYTALVENDAQSRPEDLAGRLAALPDDIQSSTLREINIAVRPSKERESTAEPSIMLSSSDSTDWSGIEVDVKQDRVHLTRLPQVEPGATIEIVVGSSPGWEFGITPGRVPYGGFSAAVGSGEDQQVIGGSLGFQTIFDQPTDFRGLLGMRASNAARAAISDPLLAIVYGAILMTVAGIWIVHLNLSKGH